MATKKKLLQAAAGTAAAGEGLNVEDVFSVYSYVGDGRTENVINNIALTSTKNDGGSVYFDGSGDYLRADAALDFHNFTNEAFCIEFWIYPEVEFTNGIIPIGINAASDGENVLLWRGRSVWYRDGTGDNQGTDNLSCQPPVNQWTHVALTSNGGDFKIFHNGTRVGNFSLSSSWNIPLGDCVFGIGAEFDSGSGGGAGNYFKGYISNVRVSNIQRYTDSFVPPSSAFADPSGDSEIEFLALRGSTPLTDESDNSVSITTFGNAAADTTFGPFEEDAGSTGGLVITKNRTNNSEDWKVYDTERDNPYSLELNTAKTPENLISSVSIAFNPDGFTYYGGGNYSNWNGSNKKYISYTFKKAEKFFDVVTYTGNQTSGRQVAHNLGSEPGAILLHSASGSTNRNWFFYHRSVGETKYLSTNNTNQPQTASDIWNDTAPTSTHFTVGDSSNVNGDSTTYVAYLFAHNDGDANFGSTGDQDIIQCGTYTGNGSNTGPTVDLGFEPQWILIKDISATNNWLMFDNMRGINANGNDGLLRPNLPDAELTTVDLIELRGNGFHIPTNDSGINGNGSNYIYIAIRRGPMAVPTDATDVFALDDTYSSGDPEYFSGWPVDFWMRRYDKTSSTDYVIAMDRLRDNGKLYLQTHSTSAETSFSTTGLDQMEGASLNGVANSMAWMWRRAPNYFDAVAYSGNGTAGRTVSHNLGVAPEMMWVKARDGGATTPEWSVYHKDLGNDKRLVLNTTAAVSGSSVTFWYSTTPTETEFYTGSTYVNQSGNKYIAYLFASLDGVSKVGSYTGNGSTQNIECGFSNGARFILIKRTDVADEWVLHDSEQGIVAGNDPYIFLNSTDAQASGNDVIDPYSGGFTVNNFTAWNASGASYIFYAIA